ncbi:MAG: polyamine aminopropyltransferase [Myxococcales bacterium]|nr:polyamine aminopropyltransferase [Myxococcales bacterium]
MLLASVFVIAVCGLVYELLAGTLSSYLLGSSVTQFSLVIGIFLSAMGIGSFLSRFVRRELTRTFLIVEILIGLVGGFSALTLFTAFATIGGYKVLLISFSVVIGTLVGLEIPLLIRIMRGQLSLRTVASNVLAVDYIGALAASLLFPLLLVPYLGLVRTGFLFGLLNVIVALFGLHVLGRKVRGAASLRLSAGFVGVLMIAGLISAGFTTRWLEDMLYDDEIVYAKTTPFQRLIITRWRGDFRLFINGNIQFSTVDEYRYHESLVHPVMGLSRTPRNVLMLGGGDGMAAREVFKHRGVESLTLVDLDPAMTRIFRDIEPLARLNKRALHDKRLHIVNTDAMKFLERDNKRYDVIIIDLPDPNNEALGKLYSRSFYRLVAKHLAPTGVMVTQATSPYYATNAFWCINNTIADSSISSAGGKLQALPYHANVPSFGDWGFVLASFRPLRAGDIKLDPKALGTRYLTRPQLDALFVFAKDIGPRPTPINRLDNQVLLRLYERGYQRFNGQGKQKK